jgi:hypothetical protein
MRQVKGRYQLLFTAILTLALISAGIAIPGKAQAFGSLTENGTAAFMGIGINPTKILHVSGTGPGTVPLFQRASDSAGFIIERTPTNRWVLGVNENPALGNGFVLSTIPTGNTSVPRLMITQDGRVGIGTTSPTRKLDVQTTNGDAIYGETGGDTVAGVHGKHTGSGAGAGVYGEIASATGAGVSGENTAGGPGVYGSSSGGKAGYFQGDVYASGNVGIGTISPGQKLTVDGTIESTSGGFKFPDATTQTTAAANQWTTYGSNIYYATGNVSIGTSIPGEKLSVVGIIESASGGFKFPDMTTQTTAAKSTQWTTSGSNIYYIGNVGIWTSSTPATLSMPANSSIGLASNEVSVLYFRTKNISGDTVLHHRFVPSDTDTGSIGYSDKYWNTMWADHYLGKSTSIQSFDIYDDLAVAEAIRVKSHTIARGETGQAKEVEVFDLTTMPREILDESGEFVDINALNGFLLGCVRQAGHKIETQEAKIKAQEIQLQAQGEQLQNLLKRIEALENKTR